MGQPLEREETQFSAEQLGERERCILRGSMGRRLMVNGCAGISWPPADRLEAGLDGIFFFFFLAGFSATADVQIGHDVAAVNWQSSGSGTTDPDNRSKQWPRGSLCLVGGQSKTGGTLDRRSENGSTWQLHACPLQWCGGGSEPRSETRLAQACWQKRQGPRP